ncbi:DUF7739 domain-containing protein [Streptomyces sp. MT206]|uniref:DUF7739 domain-containing protein n=1 Tax=Streptomyces sp. MT206 TaxID=3031407 RepID=UPI002FC5B679
MSTYIVTSHGGDFFGEDRHPCKTLGSLAPYVHAAVPADEREAVEQLLTEAALTPAGTTTSISAAVAAKLAPQLRQIARNRYLKSRPLVQAAALLADAAARAAADGEPWEWRTEVG